MGSCESAAAVVSTMKTLRHPDLMPDAFTFIIWEAQEEVRGKSLP